MMIHDLENLHYHCEYQPQPPRKEDILLGYRPDGHILLFDGKLPSFLEFQTAFPGWKEEERYLFGLEEQKNWIRFFLAWPGVEDRKMQEKELPCGWQWVPMQAMRTLQPVWMGFAAMTGWHLFVWYQSHQFCGCCQSRLEPKQDERAMVCPHCHHTEYPQIAPAVVVGIRNGNRLLLSRYAHAPWKKYALIAGFVEVGENLEAAVKREVLEETGLQIDHLQYVGSQPWGFTQALMLGFFADLQGEDHIHRQEEELAEALWVEREDIPIQPEVSLTSHIMELFRKGLDPHGKIDG